MFLDLPDQFGRCRPTRLKGVRPVNIAADLSEITGTDKGIAVTILKPPNVSTAPTQPLQYTLVKRSVICSLLLGKQSQRK